MTPFIKRLMRCNLIAELATACALALAYGPGHSRELKPVGATYTYHASEQMTVEQAKQTALDRAITEALAAEFGTLVAHSTATTITASDNQQHTSIIATGQSEVKGEWIETVGSPKYDIMFADGLLTVKVEVKGKARAMDFTQPAFHAIPVCNHIPSTEFHDGDAMELEFQAPCDGYVAAYLTDAASETAYRILPYTLTANTPMTVTGGENYLFFNRRQSDTPALVDELEMSATNPLELNDLYILFCPTVFNLPVVRDNNGYSIHSLPISQFHRWLSISRTRNPELQLKSIHITIKNSKQ